MSPETESPRDLSRRLEAQRQARSLGRLAGAITRDDCMSPAEYICALIARFPRLHSCPEPHEWDIDDFLQPFDKLSPGEQQICLFIQHVWSGHAGWQGGKFDFLAASRCVAPGSRDVIAQWFSNPFFP